jgi:hypothetical protein
MSEETILLKRMLQTLQSIEAELKKLNAKAK